MARFSCGHTWIGNHIHRGSERPGRMKKTIEFKVLSVGCFGHSHIPELATWVQRAAPATGP